MPRLRHPVRIAVALALLTATGGGWVGVRPSVVQIDVPEFSASTASRAGLGASARHPRVTPPSVVAVGDIACDPASSSFNAGRGVRDRCRAAATWKVAAGLDPDAYLILGDAQYDDGRLRAFRESYDLSWGQGRDRTYAAIGNHAYWTPEARGYFRYFGDRAGAPGEGWYSFDLGQWHLVALNSNCDFVGCEPGSAQYRWLARDLARSAPACTLAFLHHPLLSSGPHGNDESGARPLWDLLYGAGVDVALAAHDHHYERFAPTGSDGRRDAAFGIRTFVVGTGGAQHYWIENVQPASEVRNTRAFGVLRLDLRAKSYRWSFVPAAGATFTDAGSAECHPAAATS